MRMTTGIMHNERHKGIRYVLVYVWRVKGGETDEDKSENPRNQNGPKKKSQNVKDGRAHHGNLGCISMTTNHPHR